MAKNMNAILLTAIWGIIMMFGGVFFKGKQTPKYWAIAGLVIIIISNYVELTSGVSFFDVDTKFMLSFNSFNLTFITIALVSTLLYFLLSGSDIEKVGDNVSEYFALIFFVLCGVCLSATYNTLLILFLKRQENLVWVYAVHLKVRLTFQKILCQVLEQRLF